MNKRIKYKKMANKSGRNFCDELWAKIVKERDGNTCIICGDPKMTNAHHLVSRKVFQLRWNTDNGVSLCPSHHEFDLHCSPHTGYWGFEAWMKENRPEQFAIHVEQRNNITNVKTDYQETYLRLENEYKELTGEYYKFNRLQQYIMFLNAQEINDMILEGKKQDEVAEHFNVSKNALKKFIKDNKIG